MVAWETRTSYSLPQKKIFPRGEMSKKWVKMQKYLCYTFRALKLPMVDASATLRLELAKMNRIDVAKNHGDLSLSWENMFKENRPNFNWTESDGLECHSTCACGRGGSSLGSGSKARRLKPIFPGSSSAQAQRSRLKKLMSLDWACVLAFFYLFKRRTIIKSNFLNKK